MYSKLPVILMLCMWLVADQARGLTCVQCSSETQKENCSVTTTIRGEDCTEDMTDLCYKIETVRETPNNGPDDRLTDNGKYTIISRGCANSKDFKQFAKLDRPCTVSSLGGGGTQIRCLCSGNDCNAASSLNAGIALLIAGLLSKFFW